MGSITLALDEKTKEKLARLRWVNWSEVAREGINARIKIEEARRRLKTPEEEELTKWSVELGRKAKRGRFQRFLGRLIP